MLKSGQKKKPNQAFIYINERLFNGALYVAALAVFALLIGIGLTLTIQSWPAIKTFRFAFITGRIWDPVLGTFGALPFLIGTLVTSLLALAIAIPISIALAIFLGEYLQRGFFSTFLRSVTELLAGIPSVIYGFWGLYVLVPLVRLVQIKLGLPAYGVGIFTAALILSIMIIPFAASLARDVVSRT